MPQVSITRFGGLNTNINPLSLPDGNIITAVNVVSNPFGGYTKRPGYEFYQGNPDSAAVTSLWTWYQNNGAFNVYRSSGSVIYNSANGTTNWAVCPNGTIANGSAVGHEVLNNVLIIGDGSTVTRHTLDGTTFVNTSLAPIASQFAQFQDRIYAMGTANTLFWSTIDDATNWNTSGTSDSSSIIIPGEGIQLALVKNSNTLLSHKSARGQIYRWDGGFLTDMATVLSMSSPRSLGTIENVAFWVNRLGAYSYSGSAPQLISNPIQRLFYNNSGSGVAGNNFGTVPGVGHVYDYYAAVGTTTDNFTQKTTNNTVLRYDVRLNSWVTWDLAHKPTAFLSFVDVTGAKIMLFGDNLGQVFRLRESLNTDQGAPIQSLLEFMVSANTITPKWYYRVRLSLNPGCEAVIEIAVSDSLTDRTKKWVNVGEATDGVVDFRIPTNMARGVFLFVRIVDNGYTTPFELYGCEVEYELVKNEHNG